MYNNVLFVGGIHGTGKSSVCEILAEKLGFIHLSVSKIIRWKGEREYSVGKKARSPMFYQNYFVNYLKDTIDSQKKYVIDGHYCLIETNKNIYSVPYKIFEIVNPILFIVLWDFPDAIVKLLEERDRKIYSLSFVENFQRMELSHAQKIADSLHKDLLFTHKSQLPELIDKIRSNLSL